MKTYKIWTKKGFVESNDKIFADFMNKDIPWWKKLWYNLIRR